MKLTPVANFAHILRTARFFCMKVFLYSISLLTVCVGNFLEFGSWHKKYVPIVVVKRTPSGSGVNCSVPNAKTLQTQTVR